MVFSFWCFLFACVCVSVGVFASKYKLIFSKNSMDRIIELNYCLLSQTSEFVLIEHHNAPSQFSRVISIDTLSGPVSVCRIFIRCFYFLRRLPRITFFTHLHSLWNRFSIRTLDCICGVQWILFSANRFTVHGIFEWAFFCVCEPEQRETVESIDNGIA